MNLAKALLQIICELIACIGSASKVRHALEAGDTLGAAQLIYHMIKRLPKNPKPVLLMADVLTIISEQAFNTLAGDHALSYSNQLRKQGEKLKMEPSFAELL